MRTCLGAWALVMMVSCGVSPAAIPGTYVLERSDETITLLPDGTFLHRRTSANGDRENRGYWAVDSNSSSRLRLEGFTFFAPMGTDATVTLMMVDLNNGWKGPSFCLDPDQGPCFVKR